MARAAAITAILLAAGGYFVWRAAQPDAAAQGFLGYVEGETLYIGPNEGERIASVMVSAGSAVHRDDPLFAMSTALLDRSRAEARARTEQIEAQIKNLQASMSRPQQIAVLQATVERAQAALRLSRADYERQQKLFGEGHVAKAALDRAAMARDRDGATLKEAQRQIAASRMASRTQEIEAAEEQMKQARAQLEAFDIRVGRQTVKAPADGVVQDVFFRPGEVVTAGQPVIALLPPENRKVRFYVPEPKLSTIRLGARAHVKCDGCGADLYGRISFIANRQEFTPPVIFSDAERAKLVFKVEARLEGAAQGIALGTPVSVTPVVEAQGADK